MKGKRIETTSQICRIHISRDVYSTKEQAEEGAEDVYFKVVWDGTELSAETPVSVFGEQGEWQVEQYFKPPPMKSGNEYEVKAWTRNSENETDD